MKFQDDISNMNTNMHTYTRTSRNQYVPHFFKVGGIKRVPKSMKLIGESSTSCESDQIYNCHIVTFSL